MNHRIYIKDWTTLPGARFRKEGPGSAEEFRDEHLLPLLEYCVNRDELLYVHLDGCAGFATSFLEEVFGGTRRRSDWRASKVRIVCDEDPAIAEIARRFLSE